jgi:hypothetical protein
MLAMQQLIAYLLHIKALKSGESDQIIRRGGGPAVPIVAILL